MQFPLSIQISLRYLPTLLDKFHDSAFLGRIHYYIPCWEVDIIRSEMFSSAVGRPALVILILTHHKLFGVF
jgi:predicted ATP-dependent Lon-type protease